MVGVGRAQGKRLQLARGERGADARGFFNAEFVVGFLAEVDAVRGDHRHDPGQVADGFAVMLEDVAADAQFHQRLDQGLLGQEGDDQDVEVGIILGDAADGVQSRERVQVIGPRGDVDVHDQHVHRLSGQHRVQVFAKGGGADHLDVF